VTERRLIVIIRRMKRKLAPKIIEYLKAPGPKRLDVWDTVLQGFGVRVSPTGRKVWFAVVRFNGRQKRVTIETYSCGSWGRRPGGQPSLGMLASIQRGDIPVHGDDLLRVEVPHSPLTATKPVELFDIRSNWDGWVTARLGD